MPVLTTLKDFHDFSCELTDYDHCEDCQRNYTDAGAAIRHLERALLWSAEKIAHYNDIAYYAKAVDETDHPITEDAWVTWALEATK